MCEYVREKEQDLHTYVKCHKKPRAWQFPGAGVTAVT